MTNLSKTKIAIVCDWLTLSGGAEKIIFGLHQLFPNAPIFTPVYNVENLPEFKNTDLRTSYLQKFPLAKTKHQYFLLLYPGIFEKLNLDDFDLIISSSHSCAKGIITGPKTLHISYCHSPMRYAWDNNQNYIKNYNTNFLIKTMAPFFMHKMRIWDRMTADRVDYFIANSNYIKNRISKFYHRDSEVIFPFIKSVDFSIGTKSDYYLAVGRLTAYKKFDLIINAFNELKLPIKIAGSYNAKSKLKQMASDNIEFLGYVDDQKLKKLFSEAKALIFPQIEDFGIVPLEAMASGTPVIAFNKGGVTETVINGETGIFFEEQTSEALKNAVIKFQQMSFNQQKIREHAQKFDQNIFNQKILNFINQKLTKHQHDISGIY